MGVLNKVVIANQKRCQSNLILDITFDACNFIVFIGGRIAVINYIIV